MKKLLISDKKNNLKIALVSFQKDAEKVPPIGLVYLATYLKNKCSIKNVKIIDKNYDNIRLELEDFSPDIIGLGPMTINYQEAVEFAINFKKNHNTPIIIGGVHISTLPESFKLCFDVGVIGEGEETISQLVDLFIKKNRFLPQDLKKLRGVVFFDKTIVKTKLRKPLDLDSLPMPDFSLINQDYFSPQEIPGVNIIARRAFVLTSRSCPYKCKFCSTSHFWGNVRLHSPEHAAKIIADSVIKQNTTYIKILDDLFTVSPERLRQIKVELEKLGILNKIEGIECQPRANLINDELCQIMKELKVKIVNFGFESGSERILNWLKSGSVTVEMNKKAIILCKKYGFIVYGSLMFGSPGEKIEDMKKTLDFIDFAVKNKADYIWGFISTPFPDTPFWDIALQKGKVSKYMDFNLLSHHNLDNPLLLDEDVDKDEFKRVFLKAMAKLRKLKLKLVTRFFLSNPIRTMELFVKSPFYYTSRVIKQVYKH